MDQHPPCRCGYNGEIETCQCAEAEAKRQRGETFLAKVMTLQDFQRDVAFWEIVRELHDG